MRATVTIVLWFVCAAANAQVIEGSAMVIDGDTIEVNGVRIRLEGVAAPEMHESGGPESGAMMRRIIGDRTVSCVDTGQRTHKRIVAVCTVEVDGITADIGAVLIHAGHARDCPRFSRGRYVPYEVEASRALPFPSYCDPRR